MAAVRANDVEAGVRALGLAGRPVCLHSSLRSFGAVEGGADAIVDGFLAVGCTLIVPSFSWRYAVLPIDGLAPERNAWDYGAPRKLDGEPAVFATSSTEIDARMGAIPAAVVRRAGRMRGDHPLCSFTAVGPSAEAAVGGQSWSDVYAPLGWLSENDGALVLAGVSLTSVTFIHYAEELAGRTLFRRWALDRDGEVVMVPVGSCSDGFEQLRPSVASLEMTTNVGESEWRCYPAGAALDALVSAIRDNPELTRCDKPECVRCRDSIAGGPLLRRRDR